MTDTNKERAEFEAHYFAENGNRLYCESQWRGWQARAAKAPAAPGFQQALDIRTAQGWKLGGDKVPVLYTDSINGQQVCRDDVWLCATAAFAVPPAAEPVAWPKDAAEVRQFMGSNFICAEFVGSDESPNDDDRYLLSAHDFLSAVDWWTGSATDAPPAPTEQQIGALQAELAGNEAATMHLSRMVDELRALLCQAMRVMKDLHESATPDESREDCPPIIPTSDFAKFVNDNAALMYAIKQCGHDAAPPQGAAK